MLTEAPGDLTTLMIVTGAVGCGASLGFNHDKTALAIRWIATGNRAWRSAKEVRAAFMSGSSHS